MDNVKTVYSPQTQFAGGIITEFNEDDMRIIYQTEKVIFTKADNKLGPFAPILSWYMYELAMVFLQFHITANSYQEITLGFCLWRKPASIWVVCQT